MKTSIMSERKVSKGVSIYILSGIIAMYPVAMIIDKTSYYYLALIALLIVMMFGLAIRRIKYHEVGYIVSLSPLMAFVLLSTVSILWSIDPYYTLERLVPLWVYMTMSILLVVYVSRYGEEWILVMASIVSISVSLCFIYIFMKYGKVRYAIEGLETFSNHAGSMSLACMPFVVYGLVTNKISVRSGWLVMVLCVISAFISESRGFVVGSLLIIMFSLYISKSVKYIGLLFMMFVVLAVVYSMTEGDYLQIINHYAERLPQILSELAYYTPVETFDKKIRHIQLELIKNMSAEDMILGNGYYSTRTYMANSIGIAIISHNLLIVTGLGELGLMGVIVVMAIIYYSLMRLIKTLIGGRIDYSSINSYLLIATVIVIAHSFFRPQLNNPIFYIVISLALISHLTSKKHT